MKKIAAKYKKWMVAFALLILGLVCILKPEYAQNVAQAFMIILVGV